MAWRGAGLKNHFCEQTGQLSIRPGEDLPDRTSGHPLLTGLPLLCTPLPAPPSALRSLRPRPGSPGRPAPSSFHRGPRRFCWRKGQSEATRTFGGRRDPCPSPADHGLGTRVLAPWTVVWEPVSPLWTEVWAPASWPCGPWSGNLCPPYGPRSGHPGPGPVDCGLGGLLTSSLFLSKTSGTVTHLVA